MRSDAVYLCERVVSDPVWCFERLGAYVSEPRDVEILYIKRDTFNDKGDHPLTIITIGYPIFIADGHQILPWSID